MARKRMVSPGLLVSEQVAALPIRARYAFIALWMYLDDEGRGKDNPSVIRAHTWPTDDSVTTKKTMDDLNAMENEGLICRYEVAGAGYLHCPTWRVHQKINRKTESVLPPCPHHDSVSPHAPLTEPSTPREVKSIQVEDRLSEVKGSRDLTTRSAAITAAYLKLNPMAEKYPTQRIVAKAIGEAGYTDAQVGVALAQLARDGRPLTANTLYVEINGQPKTSTTNSRVSQALALAEQFRSLDLPEPRAIGDGS